MGRRILENPRWREENRQSCRSATRPFLGRGKATGTRVPAPRHRAGGAVADTAPRVQTRARSARARCPRHIPMRSPSTASQERERQRPPGTTCHRSARRSRTALTDAGDGAHPATRLSNMSLQPPQPRPPTPTSRRWGAPTRSGRKCSDCPASRAAGAGAAAIRQGPESPPLPSWSPTSSVKARLVARLRRPAHLACSGQVPWDGHRASGRRRLVAGVGLGRGPILAARTS